MGMICVQLERTYSADAVLKQLLHGLVLGAQGSSLGAKLSEFRVLGGISFAGAQEIDLSMYIASFAAQHEGQLSCLTCLSRAPMTLSS